MFLNKNKSGAINGSSDFEKARVQQFYNLAVPGVHGAFLSIFVVAWALTPVFSFSSLAIWVVIYSLVQIPRYFLIFNFEQMVLDRSDPSGWALKFTIVTIISGAVWGAAGFVFFAENSPDHQMILAVSLAGISAAASVVYSTYRECSIPTILVEILPFSGNFFFRHDEFNIVMGIAILVFGAVIVTSTLRVNRANIETLKLRFDKDELIESLVDEKEKVESLNSNLECEINKKLSAMEALIASENRLDLAVKGAHLGLWDYRFHDDTLFVDSRWHEIMGVDQNNFQPKLNSWLQLVYSEDLDPFTQVWQRHLKGDIEIFELEFRINQDEQPKWIFARGKAVERGEDKSPARISGIVQDIDYRKKGEFLIIASLAEKEVLLREIHHRVKNNLQIVSSLLRLQCRYISDETSRAAFRESENRILSMAFVHEKLYQSENLAQLSLPEYFRKLSRHVFSSYESDGKVLKLTTNFEDLVVGVDLAIPLGMILTELVANSVKHAFADRKRGVIHVAFTGTAPEVWTLSVSDDGIGIPENKTSNTNSLGLKLINIFTNQIGGDMRIRSNNGTETSVTFALRNRRNAGQ